MEGLEGASIIHKEIKVKVQKEYLKRAKLVAKSLLHDSYLIKADSAWTIRLVRYRAVVSE